MAEKTIVEKAAEGVGYGLAMAEDVAGTIKTAIGTAATTVTSALKKAPVKKKAVATKAVEKTPAKKAAPKSAVRKTASKKTTKKRAKKVVKRSGKSRR